MSDRVPWQRLTLQQFLSNANWEGTLQQKFASQSIDTKSLLSWQSLTVEIFFQQNNWQGQAIKVLTQEPQPINFSPTLPVQDFFRYFIWEAKPEVAAIQQLKPLVAELKTATQNLSIDNLTDLF
jgi:hypothetical protein